MLRNSLSGTAVPEPPALETIAGRGRARQRRRTAALTAFGAGAAAVAAGLALGLTGVLGGSSPAPAAGTIQTTAFTLTATPTAPTR